MDKAEKDIFLRSHPCFQCAFKCRCQGCHIDNKSQSYFYCRGREHYLIPVSKSFPPKKCEFYKEK